MSSPGLDSGRQQFTVNEQTISRLTPLGTTLSCSVILLVLLCNGEERMVDDSHVRYVVQISSSTPVTRINISTSLLRRLKLRDNRDFSSVTQSVGGKFRPQTQTT